MAYLSSSNPAIAEAHRLTRMGMTVYVRAQDGSVWAHMTHAVGDWVSMGPLLPITTPLPPDVALDLDADERVRREPIWRATLEASQAASAAYAAPGAAGRAQYDALHEAAMVLARRVAARRDEIRAELMAMQRSVATTDRDEGERGA